MRNPPPFREAVAEWFARVSLDGEGKPKFSDSEIQRKTGVARSTLDRIRDMGADTDEEKIAKLAKLFGVKTPQVTKVLQVEPGDAPEPRNPMGWIAEAQAALDRATVLLRDQPITPPGDDEPDEDAVHRHTKGGGPDGGGKGRRKTG